MKVILFDVDGTIIDTEIAIKESLKLLLKKHYGIVKNSRELDFVLGIPGKTALKELGIPSDEIEKALNVWEEYMQLNKDKIKLFSEITDLIIELEKRNVKMGIVTSKTREEVEKEFSHYGLNNFFDAIVTASDTKKHKPNAEPLILSAKLLNIENSKDVIYIGDSIYDYECARNFGCKFYLATWGVRVEILDDRKNSDYLLRSPLELLEIL